MSTDSAKRTAWFAAIGGEGVCGISEWSQMNNWANVKVDIELFTRPRQQRNLPYTVMKSNFILLDPGMCDTHQLLVNPVKIKELT